MNSYPKGTINELALVSPGDSRFNATSVTQADHLISGPVVNRFIGVDRPRRVLRTQKITRGWGGSLHFPFFSSYHDGESQIESVAVRSVLEASSGPLPWRDVESQARKGTCDADRVLITSTHCRLDRRAARQQSGPPLQQRLKLETLRKTNFSKRKIKKLKENQLFQPEN